MSKQKFIIRHCLPFEMLDTPLLRRDAGAREGIIVTLAASGLRDRVRTMVGGAPLDAAFAARIGADGYGRDALAAVATARRFVDRWPPHS